MQPDEEARWEEWVRQSPQGTLFHSPLWLRAAGGPFVLYGCFRGTDLRGGLAIGLCGSRMGAHLCPALTPYQGPLLPGPEGKRVTELSRDKEILGAFAAFLKERFEGVFMRLPPEINDLQPFLWAGFTAGVRYTYRLPLADLQEVWDGVDAVRRRGIRSAEKAGIVIDENAALEDVLALSARSFERQGKPLEFRADALRFHQALSAANRCRAFVARDRDGRAAGGVYIVWDERRAYYLIGGYEDGSDSSSALALAMWKAILFTRERLGLAEFDFEGSMIPAVERFFRKFGGVLMPTYTLNLHQPPPLPARVIRRMKRAGRRGLGKLGVNIG